MDLGAALTIALLAALLSQAWALRIRLGAQVHWLVAALMLNAMSLPAAILLLGDAREGLGLLAGFGAVLTSSAAGLGALIWLYRMERLQKMEERPTDHG
ncbi:MAG: hypothetical protein P3W87_006545 [Gammaproteobacteria bacterium]|nr:hypothetical protein [Gammaproteobacteria bacterium]